MCSSDLMTLAAVTTTYLCGLAYFVVTGTYFFLDSYVPIAVFLGMHLLFTDPSTSPRTELGRLLFGAMYGLSVVALYAVLTASGLPAFYDKLLQVPLMNLLVPAIDRCARSPVFTRIRPERIAPGLSPRGRNLMYVATWASVFALLSATGGVGDGHPGQWLPFWQRADQLGVSPEEQRLMNMRIALHSAGASPVSEINRGTLAHMLAQQGRLDDFIELGGTKASARGPNFPPDMRDMSSHAYHSTAHVPGLIDIEATGRGWSPKHKVPTYTAATDPVFPNYTRPVADSHFARGLGYPDVRTAASPDALFKELTNPEYDDLLPWWDRLTEKSGMRPIGNQALLWNVKIGRAHV